MTHVCLLARRSKSINKRKPNLIRKKANELQTHFSLAAETEVSGSSALVQSSGLGRKLPSELQAQQWSGCCWPSPHQAAPGRHRAPCSNPPLHRLPPGPAANAAADHGPLRSSWQPQLLPLLGKLGPFTLSHRGGVSKHCQPQVLCKTKSCCH